ncbi:MAG: hypothetical protein ABWJ99_05480 [Caldimicrobium sp.]
MLRKVKILFIFFFLSVIFVLPGFAKNKPLPEFKDVKGETQKFIDYFYTIKLSPSEQKTLEKALKPIPAPCCSDNSALTC